MSIRSRLAMLGVAVLMAVVGPWTGANADDWPTPPGDFFAGRGVILSDVAIPSNGAAGFRINVPTQGEIDVLGWLGTAALSDNEMIAIGGYMWNVDTGNGVEWFTFPHQSAGPAAEVHVYGLPAVEQHTANPRQGWAESGIPPIVNPGTYDVVIWAATNATGATTRFRVHAPADATLLNQTTSASTFMRSLQQFTDTGTGTGSADVVAAPPNEGGVVTPAAGAYAAVGMSTSLDIANSLFGEFVAGPSLAFPASTPIATCSEPTGTRYCHGQVVYNGSPAGAYTFTINASADVTGGPLEPFVAGTDIVTP